MPADASARWLGIGAAALVLLLSGFWLWYACQWILRIDDAYMFYRYAVNLRHGDGMAWNPGGDPTYGLTSQLWVWCVLPFTLLPLGAEFALRLAAWLAGMAALFVMGAAVARHAVLPRLRSVSIATLFVAMPLLTNAVFPFNMTDGMDAMLSTLANAAFIFTVLRYRAAPGKVRALTVGLFGFLAFLARPDNAPCVLLVPALIWLNLPGRRRFGDLAGLVAVPLVLILADLAFCHWYYGTALPLSFHVKAMHLYVGFRNTENALAYLYRAGDAALIFLAVLAGTITRRQAPLALAFLLPVAATFLYLLTVRQVVGFEGRYYIPFLPYLVVPTLLAADAAFAAEGARKLIRILASIAAVMLLYGLPQPLWKHAEAAYLDWIEPMARPVPRLVIAASRRLPFLDPFDTIRLLGNTVLADLPPGAVVATTEVGYFGYRAPAIPIIDLAGLNDTAIGLHGFRMDDLLAQHPDFMWLPHQDYTGLRETMFTDPRLLERYQVIDGFDFGVAIRRDSPFRATIEAGLARAWALDYPTHPMADYVVTAMQPAS